MSSSLHHSKSLGNNFSLQDCGENLHDNNKSLGNKSMQKCHLSYKSWKENIITGKTKWSLHTITTAGKFTYLSAHRECFLPQHWLPTFQQIQHEHGRRTLHHEVHTTASIAFPFSLTYGRASYSWETFWAVNKLSRRIGLKGAKSLPCFQALPLRCRPQWAWRARTRASSTWTPCCALVVASRLPV